MEIDHEIISTVILLPSADSFKKGCCQLQAMYVHKVLVNRLFKLDQEKSVVRLTDSPHMTMAVAWDAKQQIKPKNVEPLNSLPVSGDFF